MNRHRASWQHSLRGIAIAVGMAWSFQVGAASLTTLEVRGEGDFARVVVELPLGMFVDAGLTGRGNSLELRLKGADKADLAARLEQLTKKHPLLKGARILPGAGEDTRVLFEFARPVVVLDETVVALPDSQSRWEIVLSGGEQAASPAVAPPALKQVRAARRDGRLDISLVGSTGLVAEAFFMEGTSVLAVDLPGISIEQARLAAEQFHGEAGLVKGVQAVTAGNKVTRLLFELSEPADLIDTQGLSADDQGQVVMSLVPDAQAKAAPSGSLAALGFEAAEGVMQFRLSGIAGSRINAYTIEEPPRLVVDFLGWSPDQVKEAIARFRSSNGILGEARLDTTRLGSARAVFDLVISAPFQTARSISLPDAGGNALVETLLISLAPGAASSESQTMARRGPLNLRFRRELQDGRQSEVVIRAPTLESANRFAQAALRPERGKEFGLIGMLSKALDVDSKYAAAKAEFEAISEAVPQARAGYLPVASFDFQRSNIRQDIKQASNPTFPTGVSTYPSRNMTLTLTQPLFKPQAWLKMNQAAIAVEQAKVNLVAAEQDLILRVSTAYLNLLAANDGVELAEAEREATAKQNELASSRLQTGLGTITQLHDTEARLALTQAREIEAKSRLDDATIAIKEILGESVSGVKGFKADFETAAPIPATHEPWVEAALEQNLALQSRKMAQEIAGLEITRQRAGHLPTLSLVGNLTSQDTGGSLYGAGQRYDNREVGLRMSMPLTDGGLTSSMVREARAREVKAVQEREQEMRRTERLARSAFNGVQASSRTLAALRKSVQAQESALQARLEGFNNGLYNVVVVMDAYRLYYTAQRDFLQARYDYLVNRLKLKQAVGTLSRADIEDIAALLN